MSDRVDQAVAILRRGGLVAFPTETVYGLGADATNPAAVRKIFAAKGRPATNPLIVHVANALHARQFAGAWPAVADELARRFWPGPLTLVVPSASAIAAEVTAGRETVGLRAPNHPLALELLRRFGGGAAAPSANRSNRVSPTTAEHVRRELGSAVDVILDGGPCTVGIESTVLDLTRDPPRILRPGGIGRAEIEQAIAPVEESLGALVALGEAASSPGQQAVHYAPAAPAFRFAPNNVSQVIRWLAEHPGKIAALLLIEGSRLEAGPKHRIIGMPAGPRQYGQRLYAALHDADAAGAAAIFIEMPPFGEEWTAIRDRIVRATHPL